MIIVVCIGCNLNRLVQFCNFQGSEIVWSHHWSHNCKRLHETGQDQSLLVWSSFFQSSRKQRWLWSWSWAWRLKKLDQTRLPNTTFLWASHVTYFILDLGLVSLLACVTLFSLYHLCVLHLGEDETSFSSQLSCYNFRLYSAISLYSHSVLSKLQ